MTLIATEPQILWSTALHPVSRRHTVRVLQKKAFTAPIRQCRPCQAATFTDRQGNKLKFDKPIIRIGSSSDADLRLTGGEVSPQHAEVRSGEGRTTCTALVGSEEDLFGDTFTWLDGNQLRTGVGYLLGPACKLAFGRVDREYTIDFQQPKGGSGALEMLVRGMAASAPKEVQDQLDL